MKQGWDALEKVMLYRGVSSCGNSLAHPDTLPHFNHVPWEAHAQTTQKIASLLSQAGPMLQALAFGGAGVMGDTTGGQGLCRSLGDVCHKELHGLCQQMKKSRKSKLRAAQP